VSYPEDDGRDILEREPGRLSALLTRLVRPAGRRRRRWTAGLVAAAVLAAGGAVLAAQPHRPAGPAITNVRTDGVSTSLTCGELSMTATTSQPDGPRMIFGDVVLPGPGTGIIRPIHDAGWRYEIQTAFLVRGASPPVTVSVPRPWRTVAGIAPLGHAVGDTFGIPSCANRQTWSYALVSFYVHTPAACTPLDVQVGKRTATVWFGPDTRCPSDRAP
jgi:hypothetical protein